MDDNGLYDGVHELDSFFTSMDLTLTQLHETMAEITIKCKKAAKSKLYDHVTSLLSIIASNIQSIYMAQVIESMHLGMVFSWVENGLGNIINQLKNWHETMLRHMTFIRRGLGSKYMPNKMQSEGNAFIKVFCKSHGLHHFSSGYLKCITYAQKDLIHLQQPTMGSS